jgi:hypothetical protein
VDVIGLLVVVAAVVAVAAAVRSTWSPCGLSMLSSITPISEKGRGNRYLRTCAWFVLGAVVGGATLGAGAALLATLVSALDPSDTTRALVGAAALLVAVSGKLPYHRRQVNERWLDRYRPWVYGAGFGWQIGVGIATYIKSAGVYALIVLAALTGSPLAALALCTAFGFVRGLAVLLTARVESSEELMAFHRRFMALEPKVATVVDITFLGCAGVLFGPAVALAAAIVGAGLAAVRLRDRMPQPA